MQKLLEENGDIDFMEKVKLLFVDNPMIWDEIVTRYYWW
jgi:hypothetical protein